MKICFLSIPAIFIFLITFSCCNGFLREEPDISTEADTEILISPRWEANDYDIYNPVAMNANFKVIKTPEWLHVHTMSGQFKNGVATINCSASVYSDFSETGIYRSFMVLYIEGTGNCIVSVSYINEGHPVIKAETSLNVHYNHSPVSLVIRNDGNGILLCAVTEKPDWITIRTTEGNELPDYSLFPVLPNSAFQLSIWINPLSQPSADLKGKIVLFSNADNQTETTIDIQYEMGNPVLFCNINQLDFGRTETTKSINLLNQGNGLLFWKIDSLPEWLSISDTSGNIFPNGMTTVLFTCDRNQMPNGQHSHTIYLNSNDINNPSFKITVTAVNYTSNPDNIRSIDGNVTDVQLDINNDIIYLTTNQPNRLLVYDTKTKSFVQSLSLSKAPNCFSISDVGHSAIIGHAGMITVVNMDNVSVAKTLETEYNLFDIAWGSDNWCCYSPGDEVQHYSLQWLNIDSGMTYISPDFYGGLSGKTLLKKIPYQELIVASRLMTSPSGISVFNSQNRNQISYFHEEINDFWFSSDGKYLFSSLNKIFRISSIAIPTSELFVAPISRFTPNPNRIHWIDHNASSQSVWILSSITNYYFDNQREILQYEDNDYSLVNRYDYDNLYKGFPAMAHYIFSNSTGTEVIAIKNIVSDNNLNDWSLEHIPVSR